MHVSVFSKKCNAWNSTQPHNNNDDPTEHFTIIRENSKSKRRKNCQENDMMIMLAIQRKKIARNFLSAEKKVNKMEKWIHGNVTWILILWKAKTKTTNQQIKKSRFHAFHSSLACNVMFAVFWSCHVKMCVQAPRTRTVPCELNWILCVVSLTFSNKPYVTVDLFLFTFPTSWISLCTVGPNSFWFLSSLM